MADYGKNLGKYLHKAKPARGERASKVMERMGKIAPNKRPSKTPKESGVRG